MPFSIEDIDFSKLELKSGDTVIISFPLEKYDIISMRNMFDSVRSVLPEDIILIAKPKDIDLEVQE